MGRVVIDIKGLIPGYVNGSGASFKYPALNIVALNNELIALVGRNGVGKSTLLRTLSRLQPALSGNVYINGVSTNTISHSEFAKLVSFIPSEPAHASHTTVYEFVAMARYPYKGWFEKLRADDHEMVKKAIGAVGMWSYCNRFIDNLSDGERQRVMIAFAIAQDTPIIIMDEPTAYLDLPNKFEVMRLLREQSASGKTVIISTHDLQTAFGLVDTIWLMLPDGIRVGAPEDIVLSGSLNRLMDSTSVMFDIKTGHFVYKHNTRKKASIVGADSHVKRWTAHALQRLGFEVQLTENCSSDICVQVVKQEGKVQWILGTTDRNPTFDSIRDLTIYLKSKI